MDLSLLITRMQKDLNAMRTQRAEVQSKIEKLERVREAFTPLTSHVKGRVKVQAQAKSAAVHAPAPAPAKSAKTQKKTKTKKKATTQRASGRLSRGTKPHGTYQRYKQSCRCVKCRFANSEYQRAWYASKKRQQTEEIAKRKTNKTEKPHDENTARTAT